jgi:hypothetical protein
MVRGRSYNLPDDGGVLNVSAWRCGECGNLVEEILTCPESGRGEARRIVYAVRAA